MQNKHANNLLTAFPKHMLAFAVFYCRTKPQQTNENKVHEIEMQVPSIFPIGFPSAGSFLLVYSLLLCFLKVTYEPNLELEI